MAVLETISIVICSRNGARTLGACLAGVASQTEKALEVIVVSDGSKDATASIAAGFPVTLVELESNRGLSYARNAGVELASGTVVAFTDDDVIPPPDWVARISEAWLQAPASVKGIGGTVKSDENLTLNGWYNDIRRPLRAYHDFSLNPHAFITRLGAYLDWHTESSLQPNPLATLVGANMSFRREELLAVGGFNPSIQFGGDEEFVCEQLRRRYGHRCLKLDTAIVVNHQFGRNFSSSLRRSFAYGRGASIRARRGTGPWPVPPVVALFFLSGLFVYIFFGSALLLAFSASVVWISQAGRLGRAPEKDFRLAFFPALWLFEEIFNLFGMIHGLLFARIPPISNVRNLNV